MGGEKGSEKILGISTIKYWFFTLGFRPVEGVSFFRFRLKLNLASGFKDENKEIF